MKTWRDTHGRKCHNLGEVEDKGQTVVVYKYWRASKGYWQYEAEKKSWLERWAWNATT